MEGGRLIGGRLIEVGLYLTRSCQKLCHHTWLKYIRKDKKYGNLWEVSFSQSRTITFLNNTINMSAYIFSWVNVNIQDKIFLSQSNRSFSYLDQGESDVIYSLV